MTRGYYPNKPPDASDGHEFEELSAYLHLRFFGEKIHVFTDRASQYSIGESLEGVEFKELKNSHSLLHIEIAEKARADNPHWVASGIMRADNTKRYVCGNFDDIFGFIKDDLKRWFVQNRPKEVWYGRDVKTGVFRRGDVNDPDLRATVHSFVLPKQTAASLCIYRFRHVGNDWRLRYPGFDYTKQSHRPPSIDEVIAHGCSRQAWAWWECQWDLYEGQGP